MNKIPRILVVGSFAMDLIVSAERFPNVGETVKGIKDAITDAINTLKCA